MQVERQQKKNLPQNWENQNSFINTFMTNVPFSGGMRNGAFGQNGIVKLFKNLRNIVLKFFMFKVNNKNTRTTSMTSFWFFYCQLWTYFTLLLVFSLLTLIKQITTGKVPSFPESFTENGRKIKDEFVKTVFYQKLHCFLNILGVTDKE